MRRRADLHLASSVLEVAHEHRQRGWAALERYGELMADLVNADDALRALRCLADLGWDGPTPVVEESPPGDDVEAELREIWGDDDP